MMSGSEQESAAIPQDDGIEECYHCGDDVDAMQADVFKTVSDQFAHPECVADACYESREKVATTEGVFRIKPVKITKKVGTKTEVVDSYWQADCPVCYTTHETDSRSEDVRTDLIDDVCDCCSAEWMPPSDWIDDCEACGTSHRESHRCKPVSMREPFPGVEEDYECLDCEWDGRGTELQGPDGQCPECDAYSVRVVNSE